MLRRTVSFAAISWLVLLAGCTASTRTASNLAGERVHHVEHLELPDPATGSSLAIVTHVFDLTNKGTTPVTIVSSRIPINTTAKFVGAANWRLPRLVGPGETLQIEMAVKVRRPPSRVAWLELTLDSGETVRLECVIENIAFAAAS